MHTALVEFFWHGLVPFFWGMVCMFFLRRMVQSWPSDLRDLCSVLGFPDPKNEWQWWWMQEGKKQRGLIVSAAMKWEADAKDSKEELHRLVKAYRETLRCISDGRDPFERITEREYEARKLPEASPGPAAEIEREQS